MLIAQRGILSFQRDPPRGDSISFPNPVFHERPTGIQLKSRELKNASLSALPSPSYRILNSVVSALTNRRLKSSLDEAWLEDGV